MCWVRFDVQNTLYQGAVSAWGLQQGQEMTKWARKANWMLAAVCDGALRRLNYI